jgi:hypothetical protein
MQISNQISAGIVVRAIAQTNARMAELQYRWDTMRDALDCLIQERGAALADEAPRGGSGLIVKLYSYGRAVYKIDLRMQDLIRLLLRMEKRAAQEMGQWRQRGFIQKEAEYGATEGDRLDLSRLTDEELEQFNRLFDKATIPKPDTAVGRTTQTVSNFGHERQ